MKAKYALVREFSCGWDWAEFHDHGQTITYDNKEDAHTSLDEHIKDVNEAYEAGGLDRSYSDENDMAVAQVIECQTEVQFIIQ